MKTRIVPADELTTKTLRASDYIDGTERKTNRSLDAQKQLAARIARRHMLEAARWAARQRCIKSNCGSICLCGPCSARKALEHYGEKR
jgi:predicted RNA-binding protein